MSIVTRIRRRLAGERGFSLIELLVSMIIGMIVVLATFDLMDSSTRASAAVEDRVDALQRGRTAMEQIVQRLRSQVCLNTNTPAVTYGDSNEVRFFSELGDEARNAEEARRIRFVSDNATNTLAPGNLQETVWPTILNPPVNTFAGTPADMRNLNLIAGMARALEDEPPAANGEGRAVGAPVPVFRYYAFLGNDPATPALLLQTPLSDVDKARVVKISISFDARPTRRRGTKNRFDTTFEGDVYVRTADPTDPEHSPQCL